MEEFKHSWVVSGTSLNILNLASPTMDIPPPGIARYYNFLFEAVQAFSSVSGERTRVKDTKKPVWRDAGIEGRLWFALCGQAGSISKWHVDDNGVSTNVTIEEDTNYTDVVKFWAVVSFSGVPAEAKTIALNQFATLGANWNPAPDLIRVFSLKPGYTLVMPPGTIHAVTTVHDCFARGSMCWDRRFLVSHHLPEWMFTALHRDQVTNEDPASQTSALLQYIVNYLKRQKTKMELSDEVHKEAMGMIREIRKNSTPCTCKKYGLRCPCRMLGHLCYSGCSTICCKNG